MKILIIGNKGSTGRRYQKILEGLGIEVVGYDIEDAGKSLPECDKVIIASPTATHAYYYYLYESTNPHILVEKPASNIIKDVEMMNCKMVCNWAFVFPDRILEPGKHQVYYEFINTGKEGFWFDTCQLHIISDGRGHIINSGELFFSRIDGVVIKQNDIEASYYRMLDNWLSRPDKIWNVQDLIPELSYIIRKQEIENGQK